MAWRILLTAAYAVALGVLFASENADSGIPWFIGVAILLAALPVAFLVGRWWVLFAILGGIVGRTIGWDSAESDGNPALWWPYVVTTVVVLSVPLLAGLGLGRAWRNERQRRSAAAAGAPAP